MDENDSVADEPSNEPSGPAPDETRSEVLSATPTEPLEKAKSQPNSFWRDFGRDLMLATVQYANRSIAIIVIAIMVGFGVFFARKELACWLSNAESVKARSFEVRLRESAKSNKLGTEFPAYE